jgi:hypothetical protein
MPPQIPHRLFIHKKEHLFLVSTNHDTPFFELRPFASRCKQLLSHYITNLKQSTELLWSMSKSLLLEKVPLPIVLCMLHLCNKSCLAFESKEEEIVYRAHGLQSLTKFQVRLYMCSSTYCKLFHKFSAGTSLLHTLFDKVYVKDK